MDDMKRRVQRADGEKEKAEAIKVNIIVTRDDLLVLTNF